MTVVIYGRLNDPVAYDMDYELSESELKSKARSNLDIDDFNEKYFDIGVLETQEGDFQYAMLFTLLRGVGEDAREAEQHLFDRLTNNAMDDDNYVPALETAEIEYFDYLLDGYTLEEELAGHLAYTI